MTDQIITMPDGTQWKPSTSSDTVHCMNCENAVDTPEEIASYPDGNCPDCGQSWTGNERKSTTIQVTVPEKIAGGVG
jgi:DNA-directed RNA polymerase subunit RPC12/RpoP|tara:strand:- start:125 stop:355 length:231 start_codon:yes stop_codon:yes gene_type:complete